jgi:hypothetical protein
VGVVEGLVQGYGMVGIVLVVVVVGIRFLRGSSPLSLMEGIVVVVVVVVAVRSSRLGLGLVVVEVQVRGCEMEAQAQVRVYEKETSRSRYRMVFSSFYSPPLSWS